MDKYFYFYEHYVYELKHQLLIFLYFNFVTKIELVFQKQKSN